MIRWSRWRIVAALIVALWSVWVLERARLGVEIAELQVGPTPVTRMSDGSGGPPVVVAHGFAGSRQMMQAYGLTLARAGYTVHAFDFEGHGRHPDPMSGDVSAIDGTTQLLMAQTQNVIEAARQGDTPVALLGHSMATDILVRVAAETEGVGPLVLLSAFSLAVTPTHPQDMLLITGAWEPGLRAFAERVKGEAAPDVRRGVEIAPAVEHVAILHSRAGQHAALDWLNDSYGRDGAVLVGPTGWALLGLLAAITMLFAPVARLLPATEVPEPPMGARAFLAAALIPAGAAPLLAAPVDTRILPVLVADYLALHLAIYGAVQLAVLWWLGRRPGGLAPVAAVLLILWTLGIFGFALDRYGANFWPVGDRWAIIAALSLGAVPFMLADSWLVHDAPVWQRITGRGAFLASLGVAVALDFEGLFFLLMIAPVIVLFYLSFGYMGRVTAARSGPLAAGLALGLALAWALGVSFPLFRA